MTSRNSLRTPLLLAVLAALILTACDSAGPVVDDDPGVQERPVNPLLDDGEIRVTLISGKSPHHATLGGSMPYIAIIESYASFRSAEVSLVRRRQVMSSDVLSHSFETIVNAASFDNREGLTVYTMEGSVPISSDLDPRGDYALQVRVYSPTGAPEDFHFATVVRQPDQDANSGGSLRRDPQPH